jgi:16S rRNA (uracil1498-N3)-methyltransferase
VNLMLLQDTDFRPDNTIRLATTDRRAQHIQQILHLHTGDQIKAGMVNGMMGDATLESIDAESLILSAHLYLPPPPPLDLTLILGLPRPKMMRRILQCVASMGVKDIVFINTYKVEKSYWQTPWLSPENLREHCISGLEQAMDTQLPSIRQFKLFKPFAEDHLPAMVANREGWFAHPGMPSGAPATPEKLLLAIGPEGGFTPYEVSKLTAAGLHGFHIGRRILRMETAVPALLGHFYF